MTRTRTPVLAALLAALLAASALVAIPVGAVPVTLQTFVVVLVALVCTPGQAALAMGLYLALGAIGAPVFSGGQGGIAVLAGPTGGYLAGFALGAVAGATLRRVVRTRGPVADTAAATVVLLVTYACGASWLAVVTGAGAESVIAGGVAPFVVFDAVKAIGAIAVASTLRRAGFGDTPLGTASV